MSSFRNLPYYVCLILVLLSGVFLVSSFTSIKERKDNGGDYTPRLFSSQKTREIHPDFIIRVEDQKAFDNLQKSLISAISERKKKIEVRISSGQYFFKNRQIVLEKQNYPDVSIRFIGDNCILMPQGRVISAGQKNIAPLDYRNSYLTVDGKDVNIWTPFYQTDSLIQIVDENEKLCRIHVPSSCPTKLQFSDNTFIQYTEWFYSRICKVDSVNNSYVYFKVPELYKVRGYYNVNFDYRWHKVMPRFRFFDRKVDLSRIPIGDRSFYEGQAGTLFRIENSRFKSISFEGFRVYGSQADNSVFMVLNTVFDDYMLLFKNRFIGQRSRVAYVCKSNNVFVQQCHFSEQYTNILVFDPYCVRSEIYNNEFENCGLDINISMCVRCSGQDYLISGNTFVDFGYKAIAVGLGYKSIGLIHSRGIVEGNTIYYTDDYVKNIDQRGLIDGGAISIGTINENAIVRYNFINNITGAGSNRGIYCDDGAKNFTLYGNIVLNVANSMCLDARFDAVLEKYDSTQVANINKVMKYNIVNGGIKIQGRPSVGNGCIKGKNILLYKESEQPSFDIVVDNVEIKEDDILLPYKITEDRTVVVTREAHRELRKLPSYNRIKQYIKSH